ncbi:MAG: fibronectin type III domain-containing protein [Bacteroidota bacterium]
MKASILTLLIALLGLTSFAQSDKVNLLVQSPDGKTVKLLWLLTSRADLTAFDIKRKEGLQDWVKINRMPIVPGISSRKRLWIVESDQTDVVKLINKQTDLLKNKKLQETDNTFLRKLATDDNAVLELTKMVSRDYDLALIAGFAFVDHTVARKTAYQYGIFAAGTNKLIATASWNYGEIPDLNLVKEVTTRATLGKKGITVTWNADLNKMRAGYVTGFNIYRMGLRLNETPIIATNPKDLTEFTWFDKGASSTMMHQYSISAESVIGLEGIIKPYIYDPANHPREYRKPDITAVASKGFYFRDGIHVQWSFPKEFERYIKGVYIEKDNTPDGYKRVSGLLDPSARSFIDPTGSPVNSYVRFRVVALYNDRTDVASQDKVYNYFFIAQPPAPLNVKAGGFMQDKKYTIQLTWDPPMKGDTITGSYRIYACPPLEGHFRPIAEKLTKPTHKYTVQHGVAALYKFAVMSVSKLGTESAYGDTIVVQAPSLELPPPAIAKVIVANQNVAIKWDYPEIPDVKGFRLYQNQQEIATENELKKNIRDFVTARLEPGQAYGFTLRAVTEHGILSEVSLPAEISVPTPR